MRRRWALCLLALAASSCGAPDARPGSGQATPITVFAAASLTEAFEEIGRGFADRTGTRVSFNFAGSGTLALQLEQGARADVFAAADERTMRRAVDASAVATPRVFATNELVICVERGNPKQIRGLADLSSSGPVVVLADESVPAGAYAAEAFARAGVPMPEGSREQSVRAVLTKVALGEADAGIVYRTDTAAEPGTIEAVEIAPEHNVTASYLIAAARDAEARAEEFIAEVMSTDGRRILREHGFGVPGGATESAP